MKRNHDSMTARMLVPLLILCLLGFVVSCGTDSKNRLNDAGNPLFMDDLLALIQNGDTAPGNPDRVLIVDTRSAEAYLDGHIKDALSAPYTMFTLNEEPLYTNGFDEVSPDASTALADSWFTHLLVNQLVNDFVSTYEDSQIVFYGEDRLDALAAAEAIGYSNVFHLDAEYETWEAVRGGPTEMYASGVESVDMEEGSFIFTGQINDTNFDNVSIYGTHHGITYKGGGLAGSSLLQADLPPFLFQELMTYLGASPEGNMADGIYYGPMEEWGSKYPDGQGVDFFISLTLGGDDDFMSLNEVFEEAPSEFQPDPEAFETVGIEPRIGGTRDSNLLWNPGCLFCWYACVCGITSNARANEETWFGDGGIYDVINFPEDPRNYYAGRYYPRMDILPGAGETIRLKAKIIYDAPPVCFLGQF